MQARPIVLLGSDAYKDLGTAQADSRFFFDGRVGVWRNADGLMKASLNDLPETTKTATREGIDQSELVSWSSKNTKTREGIDQTERSAAE